MCVCTGAGGRGEGASGERLLLGNVRGWAAHVTPGRRRQASWREDCEAAGRVQIEGQSE